MQRLLGSGGVGAAAALLRIALSNFEFELVRGSHVNRVGGELMFGASWLLAGLAYPILSGLVSQHLQQRCLAARPPLVSVGKIMVLWPALDRSRPAPTQR